MLPVQGLDNDRTLCLVNGYHQHDYPPDHVYRAGLRYRFAVVMHTYRRDNPDMYFDADLFIRLIPCLCETIGYEVVEMHMMDRDKLCFDSFDDLALHYKELEEEDQGPPAKFHLTRGGNLVGLGVTEFWVLVGGPPLYHDSYTISLYTGENRSVELQRVSEAVCSAVGAKITGIFTGEERKQPYRPWWAKTLRWFAGSCS